jgi:hypothetical protein
MRGIGVIVAAVLCAAFAPSALAQAPKNDLRSSPQVLSLPSTVDGTTQGATFGTDDPTQCATGPSVWYAVDAPASRELVVRLQANGDLDATVDVFRVSRSQVFPEACRQTNDNGRATLSFTTASKPARYLIRVAQRSGSVAGTFRLSVFLPLPFPSAPGQPLPAAGVTRTVDPLQNTADAWSAELRQGVTYRIRLNRVSAGCVRLSLFAPGTTSFADGEPIRTRSCGGYLVFTPGLHLGGRYSILVAAGGLGGQKTYHLQVGTAGPDDTGPGVPLPNRRTIVGAVDANHLDVVDVYRFSLARKSHVDLHLRSRTDVQLRLLRDGGRGLDETEGSGGIQLRHFLRPGRYLVVVQAPLHSVGVYSLTRITRVQTALKMDADGAKRTTLAPGRAVRLGLTLTPAVGGAAYVVIDQFDPLTGWHFLRSIDTRISGGHAAISFVPPALGRYRATGFFRGTSEASPSNYVGYVYFTSQEPLGS